LFPSAIQPGTKSGRKSLEVGEKMMYTQSILSATQRFDCSRYATIGAMESTQYCPVQIMWHYLRRYV
jgi:hypothetical protein